jgi:hypothetical protein
MGKTSTWHADGKQSAIIKKAINDPVGTLDLMVYYVECGTQFTVDCGDIDEAFYASLESMFTQVVKRLQHSDQDTIDRFLPRLQGRVTG